MNLRRTMPCATVMVISVLGIGCDRSSSSPPATPPATRPTIRPMGGAAEAASEILVAEPPAFLRDVAADAGVDFVLETRLSMVVGRTFLNRFSVSVVVLRP